MNRAELVQMLMLQSDEIEKLKYNNKKIENSSDTRIKELEKKLADRVIKINESGTLAEAVLRINNLFEAADNAAAQYRENIQQIYNDQERVSKSLLENANKKAEEIYCTG